MTTSSRPGLSTDIVTALAVALGYFAMCWLGLALGVSAGVGSVWPASGFLVGLLLVTTPPRWTAISVGAFIGGVAANLGVGFDSVASVGYTLINLGEALTATWFVRYWAPEAMRLRQTTDVGAIVAVAVSACGIGGLFAASLASTTSPADFLTVLRAWWSSDVTGIIVISPVILWLGRRLESPSWSWSNAVEWTVMMTGIVLLSWWVFLVPHASLGALTQPLPLMPFAVWAAIRFGVSGAASTMLVMSAFCIWGTQLGLGPYALPDPLLAHLSVQAFVCIVSVASLFLATAVESSKRSALVHRELVLKLQTAAETERARLSYELHDDLAQKLAALKMQLELDQMVGAPRRESSNEIVKSVDGLIADVRELSRTLRPAPFEEGQLIPALTALARAEGRRAGLRVLIDAISDDVPLSRDAELACYRAVREAVTNIVKHARAHHLAVSVLTHANFFSVRVVDDGSGFDVAPAARQAVLDGHLGLMGMQERLEQVGGTLTIRSRRGGGTMVECRVPLMATL